MGATDLSVLPNNQVIFPESVFRANTASDVPLSVEGAASQTADLFRVQSNTGAILSRWASNGALVVSGAVGVGIFGAAGVENRITSGALRVETGDAARTGLVIRGVTSQSANLTEWQDVAGNIFGAVSPTGLFLFSSLGANGTLISPASGRLQVIQQAPGAPNPVIQARAAASQTGNLLQLENSAGTILTSINSTGVIVTQADILARVIYLQQGTTTFLGASANIVPFQADQRGLVVRGLASQTGNLAEFQNSAGTVLAKVNSAGVIFSKQGSNYGYGARATSEDGPDNNGYHITWTEGTADDGTRAVFWDSGQGLKCRYDGYYHFTAHVHSHSTATGIHQIVIRRNSDGATLAEYYSGVSGGSRQVSTGTIFVSAGDTILVLLRSPDGVAYTHNGQGPYIRGFYLGPA